MSDVDATMPDAMATDEPTTTTSAPAQPGLVDAAGTPPGSPDRGGERDGDAEGEQEQGAIEAHKKGTWIQFKRAGQSGLWLGRVKKDAEPPSEEGGAVQCLLRCYECTVKENWPADKSEEEGFVLRIPRHRIVRVLEEDEEGQPIVLDEEGNPMEYDDEEEEEEDDEEDDNADEEEEKAAKKKKKEKKEKPAKEKKEKPTKTIAKKEKKVKKASVEVDHEKSCRDARAWAIKLLKLDTFKDLAAMSEPKVIRTGDDDTVLKKLKDDPSGHDFNGYCLWGRLLKYAEARTGSLRCRDQLASLLVLMLTSEHDKYKDLKSLTKYVDKRAPYNVAGHLCDHVFELDAEVDEQGAYVEAMYKKLADELAGAEAA